MESADAQTTGQFIKQGTTATFDVSISFNDSNLKKASRKFITGLIIFEVIHAYLQTKPNSRQDLAPRDHATLAKDYIAPM
ncbi:hypothetical protein [Pedobacter sp.]|uniref:hypothetical protein n=1 Tax=Pedobacter sp. TaxID=1411316 RepID=UPI003D7FCB8E